MEKFQNWEVLGIKDFFSDEQVYEVLISVAKIVSKKMLTPHTSAGTSIFIVRN